MSYSIESRGQIFVKGYQFLSFAKNGGKNICKCEEIVENATKKFLIMLKNLQQMQLKMLEKMEFKKLQKQWVI